MTSIQQYKEKRIREITNELNIIDDIRAKELREQMRTNPDENIYQDLHQQLTELNTKPQLTPGTSTGSAYTPDSF